MQRGDQHLAAVWEALQYQPQAAANLAAAAQRPVHAYLIVGPEGSGKAQAASCFAAALLCPDGGCGDCGHCRAVAVGRHEDLYVLRAAGPALAMDEVRSLGTLAFRRPRTGQRQVLVLEGLESAASVAPALLKTIEEPPDSTVFILLSERLGPDLATIASRCVLVRFPPLTEAAVMAELVAEGAEMPAARAAAAKAGGNLRRARELCALGEDVGRDRWSEVPERLDGTGATVVEVVKDLVASLDECVARFSRAEQSQGPSSGSTAPKRQSGSDAQKRAERRVRRQELERGLESLSAAYGERLHRAVNKGLPAAVEQISLASEAIEAAGAALVRNPNEELLLQALLCRLDAVSAGAPQS